MSDSKKSPLNPYESPENPYDYRILIWLKRKWQLTKDLALELGRLGIVIGIVIGLTGLIAFLGRSPWRTFLLQVGVGALVILVGVAASYLIYAPARSKLRDLEARLPSAVDISPDRDSDEDDEEIDPDGTVYIER